MVLIYPRGDADTNNNKQRNKATMTPKKRDDAAGVLPVFSKTQIHAIS
jgi:hypothetical protein